MQITHRIAPFVYSPVTPPRAQSPQAQPKVACREAVPPPSQGRWLVRALGRGALQGMRLLLAMPLEAYGAVQEIREARASCGHLTQRSVTPLGKAMNRSAHAALGKAYLRLLCALPTAAELARSGAAIASIWVALGAALYGCAPLFLAVEGLLQATASLYHSAVLGRSLADLRCGPPPAAGAAGAPQRRYHQAVAQRNSRLLRRALLRAAAWLAVCGAGAALTGLVFATGALPGLLMGIILGVALTALILRVSTGTRTASNPLRPVEILKGLGSLHTLPQRADLWQRYVQLQSALADAQSSAEARLILQLRTGKERRQRWLGRLCALPGLALLLPARWVRGTVQLEGGAAVIGDVAAALAADFGCPSSRLAPCSLTQLRKTLDEILDRLALLEGHAWREAHTAVAVSSGKKPIPADQSPTLVVESV